MQNNVCVFPKKVRVSAKTKHKGEKNTEYSVWIIKKNISNKTYQHVLSNETNCHIIQTSYYDIAQQDKPQNYIISLQYS